MAISGHDSPYSDIHLDDYAPGALRRAAVYAVATVGKDDAPRVLAALLGPAWRTAALSWRRTADSLPPEGVEVIARDSVGRVLRVERRDDRWWRDDRGVCVWWFEPTEWHEAVAA